MAKIERLTAEVKVKITVDEDTAYKAIHILKIWLESDPRRNIEHTKFNDGSHALYLIEDDLSMNENEEDSDKLPGDYMDEMIQRGE